jgi:hypothetical protein
MVQNFGELTSHLPQGVNVTVGGELSLHCMRVRLSHNQIVQEQLVRPRPMPFIFCPR